MKTDELNKMTDFMKFPTMIPNFSHLKDARRPHYNLSELRAFLPSVRYNNDKRDHKKPILLKLQVSVEV